MTSVGPNSVGNDQHQIGAAAVAAPGNQPVIAGPANVSAVVNSVFAQIKGSRGKILIIVDSKFALALFVIISQHPLNFLYKLCIISLETVLFRQSR